VLNSFAALDPVHPGKMHKAAMKAVRTKGKLGLGRAAERAASTRRADSG